jgi:D-alanyl-D-alanine carboxypeptidase/D-alanyl-D-alanine-endopeptidase (penicillin-binding protein 4)
VRVSRPVLVSGLVALALVLAMAAVQLRRGAQRAVSTHPPAPAATTPAPPPPPPAPLDDLPATAPVPTPAGLAAGLAPLLADPALGPRVAATVVDARDGTTLLDRRAGELVMPASTAKLATGAAALEVLGGQTRFVTGVVAGAVPDEIVLVGGGDSTLAMARPPGGYPWVASVEDLATAVAAAGVSRVSRVVVDAGMFAEPRTAPGWKPTYVTLGNVAPVTALMVDGARLQPATDPLIAVPRDPDPDLAAGRALLAALGGHGVAGPGATVARGTAAAGARELATVSSPDVAELVERMLRLSDNDTAEALARHISLRLGGPATFAGGADAVRRSVEGLGLPPGSVILGDGSGLSRDDRVQPAAVVGLLVLAASPAHPELRPLLTGLPVAGFAGTLVDRFRSGTAATAAGEVRAKTGTLVDVSALAGIVVDADGRLLAFDLTADAVPAAAVSRAEAVLDRAAATLAGCGCR